MTLEVLSEDYYLGSLTMYSSLDYLLFLKELNTIVKLTRYQGDRCNFSGYDPELDLINIKSGDAVLEDVKPHVIEWLNGKVLAVKTIKPAVVPEVVNITL